MLYRAIFHHRQFRYLGAFYLHSITRFFAISIFQLFNGIYIFHLALNAGFSFNQALSFVALSFCFVFACNGLAVAPALWLMAKKGLRFSVFWGNICLILYFVFLWLSKYDLILLIPAGVFSGLQISLYWVAYHIYFTKLSDDKKQGEEISMGQILSALAAVGGPAFGGLIISYWGFEATFLIMSILLVLAVFPLKYLPKQDDKITVNILQLIRDLSPKKEFKTYLSLFGLSITETIFMIFWPIYIFPILSGFVGVGFVGSIVAVSAVVSTMIIGLLIDKVGAYKLIKVFSSLDAIVWVIKTFVSLPMHVFAISIASAVTRIGQNMSVESQVYHRARHEDVVSIIVQREVGLAAGRFIFMLVVGLLFWFGMPLVFILIWASAFSLLTKYYPKSN
jgi:MFS family permease